MWVIDVYHFCDPLIVVDVGRMGYEGEFFQQYDAPNPEPYFECYT